MLNSRSRMDSIQAPIIAVIGYGNHFPMAARRDTVKFVVKR